LDWRTATTKETAVKRIAAVSLMTLFLIGCNSVPASDRASRASARPAQATSSWAAGLGDHHHPVSTDNPVAQRAFDEGLILIYAFNHDEAIRSFKRALELDPNMAMAYWGIALALGPNYNIDVDSEREKQAYEAIQKAVSLMSDKPPQEQDYIRALAVRYSNEPKPDLMALNRAYAKAMGSLMRKYPDDLDAATLYAESMMVLRPWKLWSHDGVPAEGTEELVAVLESVLKRNPDHVGANHLYIHAVEASKHPERALDAAGRLPGLAPSAGHLVHMPSHIYIRTGDYEAAASSNVAAVEADEEYMRVMKPADGAYTMMYYPHNIHFLAVARGIQGRSRESCAAAEKLVKYVAPHVPHMAMLEGFMPVYDMMLARAGRWEEILKQPEPDKSMPTTHALWHFCRGMAFAATGKPAEAQREHDALVDETRRIPKDAGFSQLNTAHPVLAIADKVLAARIAVASNNLSRAIDLLEQAGRQEAALNYSEPSDWLLPCHEMLGAILLRANRSADAEKAFRKDLEYNPRSGRSLFGLCEALKAQARMYEAQLVEQQVRASWKGADGELTVAGL
jgi:tetratricopeptide (TPR) repeat protein